MARAVVFLASDDGSFINGTELFVDGGLAWVPSLQANSVQNRRQRFLFLSDPSLIVFPLLLLIRARSCAKNREEKVMKYASAWRRVVLAAMLTGAANSAGAAIATDSVWGFINAVLAQPVGQGFPDDWLDATLEKTMDTPREMRYAGAGPLLEDGTRLAQLELIRYANGIPAPLIVGASISGRCIAIREIEDRFENTQLMALPTHGYPGAAMTYRSQAANGVLEFFVDMRSRCLSTLKIFMGTPAGGGGR